MSVHPGDIEHLEFRVFQIRSFRFSEYLHDRSMRGRSPMTESAMTRLSAGTLLPRASRAERDVAAASTAHCTAHAVLGDGPGRRFQAESHLQLLGSMRNVTDLREQVRFAYGPDPDRPSVHIFDIVADLDCAARIAFAVKPTVRLRSGLRADTELTYRPGAQPGMDVAIVGFEAHERGAGWTNASRGGWGDFSYSLACGPASCTDGRSVTWLSHLLHTRGTAPYSGHPSEKSARFRKKPLDREVLQEARKKYARRDNRNSFRSIFARENRPKA